ncbi:MAG: M14 family zinc carboxypeptidase [Bacteroidia bacterium]|nr:M14 family zinc carboxypeptidase [Bacteroidia bacterium]
MRTTITLSFLCIFSFSLMAQDMSAPLHERLSENYEQFKESSIRHRRFKHQDLQPLIEQVKGEEGFRVKKLGESIEGRSISMVSIGSGETSVLLWSQMHGNEPTASMAIMDIFNFFRQENDFEEVKARIKQELTLHFIPMLNPDGAERFQRRNANGVDLNRDALRLQNPEAQILKDVRDSLDADWGFNLHDQGKYYAAGPSPYTASISVLAPAFNYNKDINGNRANAMQLIGIMHEVLQAHIPNRIGRYNDDFEPRAFGDNIQKWGTRTILIESGGYPNDPEKQVLRKMNFLILLESFSSISEGSYRDMPLRVYESIPFNSYNHLHDLILRKVAVPKDGKTYTLDLGIRRFEVDYDRNSKYFLRSSIQDIGDLSTSHAYEEFNAEGYEVEMGKSYPKLIKKQKKLSKLDPIELLKEGYTSIKLKESLDPWITAALPLHISGPFSQRAPIALGYEPSLLFKKGGKITYVLVNGFLWNLEKEEQIIRDMLQERLGM